MAMCSGKRRYRDRIAAELDLARIQRVDHTNVIDKIPQRAYPCPRCRGYHLTSQKEPRP